MHTLKFIVLEENVNLRVKREKETESGGNRRMFGGQSEGFDGLRRLIKIPEHGHVIPIGRRGRGQGAYETSERHARTRCESHICCKAQQNGVGSAAQLADAAGA